MWALSFLLLNFSLISIAVGSCPLKDGDLVFIKSQTNQAKLLKIVTDSEWSHVGMAFKRNGHWDIIEAVQPVQWTSLYSFIRRSNKFHFEVFRPNFEFDSGKVRTVAEKNLGKDYDLIFGWDDQRWYCSELVWKAYEKSSKEHIGTLEKIGELNINDPKVMSEVKKRFTGYNMSFNPEEWKETFVITPIQMMKSVNVMKVIDQTKIETLRDCLSSQSIGKSKK